MATTLADLDSAEITFKQVEIGVLPLYNQDHDAN